MNDQVNSATAQAAATAAKVAPEVTPITMTDGRVVNFTGKQQMLKEVVVEADASRVGVRFDFKSGQTIFAEVPSSVLLYAAGHGYAQKLGDEVAGMKDADKQPASCEDKFIAIEALHDRIASSGDWNKVATGGGSVSGASVVLKALMEASGLDLAAVKAYIEKKLADAEAKGQKLTRAALYASFRNPTSKVGQIIERLEREKAVKAPAVDSDAALEEMMGS